MPVSTYPYWMKRPSEAVFRRLQKIQALTANAVRTVRNIAYKLYPGLHGEAIKKEYNTTIKDVVRGRILGMIPWDNIREAKAHWHSPRGWTDVDTYRDYQVDHITDVDMLATMYSRDKRPSHLRPIVVIFEKDTVVEQFVKVCRKYNVRYDNLGGQCSWTEKNKLATRRLSDDDLVLYFGDNDTRGIEIFEVIKRDLRYQKCHATLHWVALTRDQEERFGLPENAALDGLDEDDLEDLVEEIVVEYIDLEIYEEIVDQEKKDKKRIRAWTVTAEIEEEDET